MKSKEEIKNGILDAREEYAIDFSYSSMVVIHDLVKNFIRKYEETKSSNKKLLDTYNGKYPDVVKSLTSEIEDSDKFITDLKKIKNKIIEINNNK